MVLTAILGVLAGIFPALLLPYITDGAKSAGLKLEDASLPLVCFGVALLAAALVLMLLGVKSSPVVLILAALVGLLRQPLMDRFTSR